ncbi:hypothetical protein [Crucian carp herpesvirus]|uniref:ORF28A n=1 Tax=Cyprinid herpesvirus 2 TaxID=317878 RepID=K7PCF9_CYHV2|nr:protein ORF28A [Cyprinid herpesvirus 2]APD51561.1 hypothetical protein [Crucian carp herpesvirus]AFJ20602.1 protein ORF28A [Cyprinid herpesvirus 2]AKC01983.1 hypothetical protein [Cyprinid herpesvirus 2]AMB21603.1 ORF28A [Cyprinid herpesvirus 2]QAU54759.1 protein ORF28A [Cyprinid herpesvirus 2]
MLFFYLLMFTVEATTAIKIHDGHEAGVVGSSVTLHCDCYGDKTLWSYSDKFSYSDYVTIHDRKLTFNNASATNRVTLGDACSITFSALTLSDSGNYACTAAKDSKNAPASEARADRIPGYTTRLRVYSSKCISFESYTVKTS